MESIVVRGGGRLCGSVRIPGAKNSVLPLMAAAVLSEEAVTLTHVPHLSDVDVSLQILRSLGCRAAIAGDTVAVQAAGLRESAVPQALMSAMRSSIFFLAPLLVRTGRAEISMPGGCRLGARPIDIHLEGLQAMGVETRHVGDALLLEAPHGLHAAEFSLRLPSVGATETLLMAAAGASGETVLHGAALEPEIEDLIYFLRAMGVAIEGLGTPDLHIFGCARPRSVRFAVCPDRIVAATVLCAVAGCGGDVMLRGCAPHHLTALLPLLHALGCEADSIQEALTPAQKSAQAAQDGTGGPMQTALHVRSNGPCAALGRVETGAYPALPTDVAPLLAAAALRAGGETVLHDTIFENRFACAAGFSALGAQVWRENPALCMRGVPTLRGAALHAQDLRGGAALVLAALQAEGSSTVAGTENIRRGYEDIVALFEPLGAEISWNGAQATVAAPETAHQNRVAARAVCFA